MTRPVVVAVSAVILALSLAGCVPTSEPVSSPSPSASESDRPTASAAPSATPTAAPVTLVDCEAMLSIDQARALFSADTEFFGEFPVSEFGGRFEISAIREVLLAAPQAKLCVWGVPNSDGSFALVVADISAADRATLTSALNSNGFPSEITGGVTTLELEAESVVSTVAATHALTDDIWVLCDGTSLALTAAVVDSARVALRAANPTLGI